MPSFFTSAPTEILIFVFMACDSLEQVEVLMLTSRRLHSIWLLHSRPIIWAVGRKTIPAFDRALLVVRATEIVKNAQLAGHLPPKNIDLLALRGQAHLPNRSEFQKVLDLNRLVKCLELQYALLRDEGKVTEVLRWPSDRNQAVTYLVQPPCYGPEEPQGMRKWKERFHRAIYLSFLMGAVLAGAYSEPLSGDFGQSLARRMSLFREDVTGDPSDWINLALTSEELAHLQGFPVYDLNNQRHRQKRKEVFGPLAKWIINSTLSELGNEQQALVSPTRSLRRPPNEPQGNWPDERDLFRSFKKGTKAEGEAVVWTVMQAVHVFEFVLTRFHNPERLDPRFCSPELDLQPRPFPLSTVNQGPRKVSVVPFGIFHVEEIALPRRASAAVHHALPARTVRRPEDGGNLTVLDIDIEYLLNTLYLCCGIPNRDNDLPTPPPPLQFFTYFLWKHFNLRFQPEVFTIDQHPDYQDYENFRLSALIFSNGAEDAPGRSCFDYTNGSEILEEYEPPLLTYEFLEFNPRFYNSDPIVETNSSSEGDESSDDSSVED